MHGKPIIIKNGLLINEGVSFFSDILIRNGRIERIDKDINHEAANEIDAGGKWIIPGIIDDQVHFREPGMTYKADIASESKAAIAGGVTSFMEMPNTKPSCLTQELLADKYDIGAATSYCNYSFYMGASNDNLEQVLRTNPKNVCGVKIFMGSSTGNMLVDNQKVLQDLFSNVPMLIATHCEDEETIRKNLFEKKAKYGIDVPIWEHPNIRSREGCMKSSSMAVSLAKQYNTRLHILHISTRDEIYLFDNKLPLSEKRITSEVCVHHLHFNQTHYSELDNQIKCNPAIKTEDDQEALFQAMLDDKLDVIATDHAPHTWEEKSSLYLDAPSGIPLVQHSLVMMLGFYHKQKMTKEKIVEKMCHSPAIAFKLKDRGFLKEGFKADIVILDPDYKGIIKKQDVLYKCGWSPLEGHSNRGKVDSTFLNGTLIYNKGKFINSPKPERLEFNRDGS